MRERIDVSEIEAKTKIRAKYLRALENEEWGLLPGPTFVKSFLRTYADALDLDGKAMVEEYRLHHERPSDAMLEPIVSTPQSRRTRASDVGPSRGYVIAVSAIGIVIVALIALLVAGGGSSKHSAGKSSSATAHHGTTRATHRNGAATAHRHAASSQIVALSLKPTAAVYVCLINAEGHKLIPGLELQPGKGTPTYHSKRFEIRLGNSSVTMYVDGKARTVAPSSQPIGYSLTKANGRQALPASRLPSCA
jgi:cytoskeleton protein RodZ